MHIEATSIKAKFKPPLHSKCKNETKRQKLERQVASGRQQGIFPSPDKVQQQEMTYRKSPSNTTNTCTQPLHTFISHVCHEGFLLFCQIFKMYTLSSIVLSLISMAEAFSAPQLQLFKDDDDLVLCIPDNATDACIKYVNSSIYGLIVLNESVYPALKAFHGLYDYQMIARINPFWLSFEPPTDASYYIMGTLYSIIFVFGVTGNGLVIYMFARCKALRTTSNILVFNLAISDFIIIVKCPVAIYNNFMRGPALGDWGCRLYAFVGGFSGCASIGLLTAISVDRYSVIVNPLNPLCITNTQKYYYCLLFLAWFEACFFSVIPLLEVGLSNYVPEGYLTTCSFDYLDKTTPARIFMFTFFVFAFCFPLSSICYCYFHILKAVLISKDIQSNHNKHKMEVRLAFIVLLVIGLWFVAWTPYSIVAMAGVFGMEKFLTPTRSMVPALFCKTASCLNPFLYTISHKKFRNELQRLFFKRKPIYQYSMTKSSYLRHSSRYIRQRTDNNASVVNIDAERNNLKPTKVKSSLYGAGDSADTVFQQRTHHKKSLYSRKQITPMVSFEDGDVFVLQVENSEDLRIEQLQTSF